jgi:PAS domain S-box-containing protein
MNAEFSMNRRKTSKSYLPYLYATLVAAITLVLQSIIEPYNDQKSFLILYPAVVFCAFSLGTGPTLFFLALSVSGFLLFFSSDEAQGFISSHEAFTILIFILTSTILAIMIRRDKDADKVLKKTVRQLRNIQHALDASSIVAITDTNGVIKFVNDKFCQISKYSKEEIIGKTHRILNSGYHDRPFYKDLWETIISGKVWQGEIKNKAKDGSYYWVDTVITPLLDENGMPYEYIAIRNDITHRKTAEEELKKTKTHLELEQSRLLAIIEQMPAAVWVAEAPSGKLIFGNALSKTLMKQPEHPASELSEYGGYIGYKDGVRLKATEWPLAKALLTGKKIINEVYGIERPDGSLGHARFDAAPIFNSKGDLAGAIVIGTDITDQVNYQKAILQSEDRLKRATETTGIGIWELDTRTLELNRTPTHDSVYGVDYDQGKEFKFFFDKFLPEDKEKLTKNISQIMEDEKPQKDEYRISWPDGSIHWIELTGSVRKDDEGNIINVIGTISDITSRKISQGLLENIVEHSPLPIVVIDISGIVKLWNPACEKLFGWSSAEVRGKLIPLIAGGREEEFYSILSKVKQGHKVSNLEMTRLTKSKNTIDVLISASPLPNREDIIALFSDLTQVRQAEESRKKSERMVQEIIDRSPYLTYIKDKSGAFILVNSEFEKIFNKDKNEIIGNTDFELFSDEEAKRFSRNDEKVWREKIPYHYEEIATIDGKQLFYMSTKFPLLDDKGNPYAIAGISIDITQRKEMENTLRAHESELKYAVEARDRFLSIASHELKTPLTSMKLQLQFYKRQIERHKADYLAEARVNKLITDSLKQTSNLERLVNDMLDISRINTGKLTYHFDKTDMCEIVNEAVESVRPTIERSGSKIIIASCGPLFGMWDAQRMEQVLINLLTNAARYGKGNPIHVNLSLENGWVRIEVADQGMGIDIRDQERIFGQFERAVRQNEISGFGLGLYIAKKILSAHGGNLTLKSALDKGSVFTISLPLFREINQEENLSL